MVTEADFRTAILPFTLHEEGGLSSDRKDPGNWTGGAVGKGVFKGTKYGIAAGSHPSLDIAHLTQAQACDIYWQEYCVAPGFDRLSLPVLAAVFDGGVMSGPARGRLWLATAAAHATEAEQVRAVCAARLAFCKSRSTWKRYGKTWGPRIEACQAHALALVAAAPAPLRPRVPAVTAHPQPVAPKPAFQPPSGVLARALQAIAAAFLTHTAPQPQRA